MSLYIELPTINEAWIENELLWHPEPDKGQVGYKIQLHAWELFNSIDMRKTFGDEFADAAESMSKADNYHWSMWEALDVFKDEYIREIAESVFEEHDIMGRKINASHADAYNKCISSIAWALAGNLCDNLMDYLEIEL